MEGKIKKSKEGGNDFLQEEKLTKKIFLPVLSRVADVMPPVFFQRRTHGGVRRAVQRRAAGGSGIRGCCREGWPGRRAGRRKAAVRRASDSAMCKAVEVPAGFPGCRNPGRGTRQQCFRPGEGAERVRAGGSVHQSGLPGVDREWGQWRVPKAQDFGLARCVRAGQGGRRRRTACSNSRWLAGERGSDSGAMPCAPAHSCLACRRRGRGFFGSRFIPGPGCAELRG